ncbi:MAG: hypothetical protein WB870_17120 [Gallionellaceae bacterium]
MKIIRSIDVGYGNTKFVKPVSNDIIQCGIFPSFAPTLTGPLLNDPLLKNADVVSIDIGGITRVVGKDGRP